jgi:hypothetical protein
MRVHGFAAFLVVLSASVPAAADLWGDYANAWLGPRNPERWTDLVARPERPAIYPSSGPRSWDAHEQNPWANTFGTPSGSRWRATTAQPFSSGIVRMCSCYLPADARSWDGGPLTDADITRLCRAQCY